MKRGKLCFSFAVLSLVFALLSVTANAQSDNVLEVIINQGDTLDDLLIDSGIPITVRNLDFIAQHNDIDEPNVLPVGLTLKIPLNNLPDGRYTDCVKSVCFEENSSGSEKVVDIIEEEVIPKTNNALNTKPDTAQEEPVSNSAVDLDRDSPTSTIAQEAIGSPASDQPEFSDENRSEDSDVERVAATRETPEKKEKKEQEPDRPKGNNKPILAQPNRAPGIYDIDEDAATRALERTLVLVDALLLPAKTIEMSFRFNMVFDEIFVPVLVESRDENGEVTATDLGQNSINTSSYGFSTSFAVGLPYDAQLALEVPVQSVIRKSNLVIPSGIANSNVKQAAGLGDVNISLLKTLVTERGSMPDLIASVSVDTDTGESQSGIKFGSGSTELGFGLTATKRQDPLVFSAGISHSIAQEADGFKRGDTTGINIRTLLAASPRTSLSFAFSQSWNQAASAFGVEVDGSEDYGGVMSLGVSSVLSSAVFLSAGVSIGLSPGSSNDYSAYLNIAKRIRSIK